MPRPRLLADVTPLRESAEFRRLYFGQLISFIGTQLTMVAVPYQVYVLTDSSFVVGLVSLAQVGPLLVGSLFGGAIADVRDRRRILLVTAVGSVALSAALAVNASLETPQLWPLFVLSAAAAGLSGIHGPARSASIPNLVRKDLLPAAYALWQTLMQVGSVVGPAVAGLLIADVGLASLFWIDAATYGAAFVAVLGMRPMPPLVEGGRVSLASIAEGLRYVRSNRVILGSFVIDLNAMIFGMPRALFPALGLGQYGGDAGTVGLLYAAPAAGALVGSVTTGWVGGVRRQGRAVLLAVAVWGLAITGFGLSGSLLLGLILLAVAGAADVVSAVFRNTIMQVAVPDSLRGRLSATHIAVVTGGPRLGDLEAGAVAAVAGPRFSVVSGGLACVAGVLLTKWRLPEFANQHADTALTQPDTGRAEGAALDGCAPAARPAPSSGGEGTSPLGERSEPLPWPERSERGEAERRE